MSNKIITILVGIAISIIVFGSVLMPVVANSQMVLGEPITYYNDDNSTFRYANAGDIIEAEFTVGETGNIVADITLNGENIEGAYRNLDQFFVSDAFILFEAATSTYFFRMYEQNVSSVAVVNFGTATAETPATMTISFTDDEITLIGTGATSFNKTYSYTWALVPCLPDDGEFYASDIGSGLGYVKDGTDPIICTIYRGGINTPFWYKDGEFHFGVDGVTATIDNEYTLVDGTTDIYTLKSNVTFTSGDIVGSEDEFRLIIPYEVNGHKDSGAAFSLVGAIPIIVIVAVLLMAVSLLFRSRY